MSKPFAILICAIVLSLAGARAQKSNTELAGGADRAKSPWTSDDVVMAEQASGFQISPDNRLAVWVKSTPDKEGDRGVSNLILTSLADGSEVQLTREGGSSPKWSPDGKLIAFTSGRSSPGLPKDAAGEQLWLISPSGGEAWRASSFVRSVASSGGHGRFDEPSQEFHPHPNDERERRLLVQ